MAGILLLLVTRTTAQAGANVVAAPVLLEALFMLTWRRGPALAPAGQQVMGQGQRATAVLAVDHHLVLILVPFVGM